MNAKQQNTEWNGSEAIVFDYTLLFLLFIQVGKDIKGPILYLYTQIYLFYFSAQAEAKHHQIIQITWF